MNSLEFTILNNLVTNDQFRRQTFPYLKKEYFEEEHNKLLFDLISNFINCPLESSYKYCGRTLIKPNVQIT